MRYLAGVDIGTSGTKTVLFDEQGRAVSSAAREYPLYQPQNGWAEQEPEDWWRAAADTIREAVARAGVDPAHIRGVGLSGQMHGLVMLDGAGRPLRRSILWCDGRTGAQCREITEKVGAKRLVELTANPALTGFTAGKVLWVRAHEPKIYAACRMMLLPKDYIRYKLTGEYATEASDAAGTNLFDVPNRVWSREVLEKLGIDPALLPRVYESPDVTGAVTREAAALTGLAPGTAVVGGAGDNAAAAVGTGVVKAGRALLTIGTSGVIFAHADTVRIEPEGRVHAFCSAVPGCYTVMSCTLAAGLSLKWLRDNFFHAEMEAAAGTGADPYELLNAQAARVPIGANRLLFLPYLMGERSPLLDEHARGAFIGLSAIHTKYDMLRAVMEGVAYSQRACADVLRGMGIAPAELIAAGGGARSALWRQMFADVTGCPVRRVSSSAEGPALGAALLAGVGAGVYATVPEACDAVIRYTDAQEPDLESAAAYEPYYRLYRSLYPSLREQFAALSNL